MQCPNKTSIISPYLFSSQLIGQQNKNKMGKRYFPSPRRRVSNALDQYPTFQCSLLHKRTPYVRLYVCTHPPGQSCCSGSEWYPSLEQGLSGTCISSKRAPHPREKDINSVATGLSSEIGWSLK